MKERYRTAHLPREVIRLTTYPQLDLYLDKFSTGELGLVLLVGRHGTGKSESVRRALNISPHADSTHKYDAGDVLYVEGHMRMRFTNG